MSTTPSAYCQHCGQPIAGDSQFCSRCGKPQPSRAATAAGSPMPSASPMPLTPAYAAAPAVIPSSAQAVTRVYAGFWMRFIAVVIDGLIVGFVTGPIITVIQMIAGLQGGMFSGNPSPENINVGLLAASLALAVSISVAGGALYEAWLLSTSKQATVGKMIFRIKVTDMNGQRISFARGLGRHFAKFISSFCLLIGYLMQPFTARRQALHDMIAGTLVMREIGPPYAIAPPPPAPSA